jgi:hypothetical protein
MEDASRDRDALEGVRAVKRWGARPREITKGDGIEHLKRDLGRKELTEYGPESGYPTFSMLSELGAHPGALGNLLFSLRPDSRFVLRAKRSTTTSVRPYRPELAGTRQAWCLWETCEAVAKRLGWDDWLTAEIQPIFVGGGPLMMEAKQLRQVVV